jgi:hypothetical protein
MQSHFPEHVIRLDLSARQRPSRMRSTHKEKKTEISNP